MVHLSFGIISSHIQRKYIVSISSVWNFVLFCNVDCNSIIFFQTYVLIIHFIKINVFRHPKKSINKLKLSIQEKQMKYKHKCKNEYKQCK